MLTFEAAFVLRNILRHDECEYLWNEIRALRHEVGLEWYDRYANTEESPLLTQREMWNLAIEEALLVVDSRMTWLREQ